MTLSPVTLGHTLSVSPMGFGGMALSHIYGGTDDASALRTLSDVVDLGITFLDTADVYGQPRPGTVGPAGTNEELIGQFLATSSRPREELTIATKCGITGAIGTAVDESVPRTRGDRAYIHAACDASLQRLGIDTIDLYYLHRRDVTIPVEETVSYMAELVTAGKVRHLGLSEVTATELRAAHAVHPIAAVQSEWSVFSRDVEDHVVPTCAELTVGFVPYSPLGRGLLTATLSAADIAGDFRGGTERMGAGLDHNLTLVARIAEIAQAHDATAAQVALAWIYHRAAELGVRAVPIPGSRKSARMADNLGALDLLLTAPELAQLGELAAHVQGQRNIVNNPAWISSGRE